MSETDRVPIRSFRVVFKLDRRIHKIDEWRIPLPFGIPLRGMGYAAGLLLGVLVASGVPLAGDFVTAFPPPIRFVLAPIAFAYLLTQWELDGRPAHATGLAWLRMQMSPGRIVAFRAAPARAVVRLGPVTVVPDDRSSRLRPARITGPAEVVLRYPVAARSRGRTLRVTGEGGAPLWRGKQVRLGAGQRMEIR